MNEALRLAYEEINRNIRQRERSTITVFSILLPSSFLLASLSLAAPTDSNLSLNAFSLVGLSFGALILEITVLFYWYSSRRVDKLAWDQVHHIERRLKISEGHLEFNRILKKEAKKITWLRRNFWGILFGSLTFFYFSILLGNILRPEFLEYLRSSWHFWI